MRICFLEDSHLNGGTQIWVSEAVNYCIGRGAEVSVLGPRDMYVTDVCKKTEASVYCYDWDDVTTESEESEKIWAEAMQGSDVVVCTVNRPRDGFHCVPFAGKVIKKYGIKTVFMPKTGSIVPTYPRTYYIPNNSVDVEIIAIAEFTRKYLVENYKILESVTHLIYQGTEIDRFKPAKEKQEQAKEQYPLPDGSGPVIGFTGNFEERKGLNYLIEAVSRLSKSSLPGIQLMLVGNGPEEANLLQLADQLDIRSRVHVFPFTTTPDLAYSRFDMLALTSTHKEGLPNCVLEALAMNIPVIASDMTGIPEAVIPGKTGFLTGIGDVDDIASKIDQLWTDTDLYQTCAANARQLITDRYDKMTQFEAFFNFFKQHSDQRKALV